MPGGRSQSPPRLPALTRVHSHDSHDVLTPNMLTAFNQRFSAVAVMCSFTLAALAVLPTVILTLHALISNLNGCDGGGQEDVNLTGCGLLPEGFARKGTISFVAASFDTPQGRVFFGCMLLSSLTLFVSQFPFWLPRRPVWRRHQSSSTASEPSWLDEEEGRNRFIWLFAGSLFMAVVSMINATSDIPLAVRRSCLALHMRVRPTQRARTRGVRAARCAVNMLATQLLILPAAHASAQGHNIGPAVVHMGAFLCGAPPIPPIRMPHADVPAPSFGARALGVMLCACGALLNP